MKLLIGYDGLDCADAAIDDLRRAGLSDSGEARIVSVAEVWSYLMAADLAPTGVSDWAYPAIRDAHQYAQLHLERAQTTAAAAASRFGALFPGWKVTSSAVADAPHWALVKIADEWKPDLLVMGSHGRSLLGRLMLGSVSHSVLTHARCSVRIGRSSDRKDQPPHLIVGVDGSMESSFAISAVAARKWPAGSKARVISVVDSTMLTTVPLQGFVQNWIPHVYGDAREWVSHATHQAAKELRESGLSAEPLVLEGDPKGQLLAQAEKWPADCIFVGAKGMGRLARFLLGSVSAAVASRAHCSVEVVRGELPVPTGSKSQ